MEKTQRRRRRTASPLILPALAAAWAFSGPLAGADVVVCPGCAVKSVREAIDAVDPGGTIRVRKGTYRESRLVIRKPLRLVGEDKPVIDGGGDGNVLLVSAPDVEIFERDQKFFVRVDLPGLTKEDVKINVTHDELTIEGERKVEKEEKHEGFYRTERTYGQFFRRIWIPVAHLYSIG